MDLFPTAAILLVFVINMYPSTYVTFDSSPQDSLIFVSDRNTTNITLIWTFTVESGKRFFLLELRRFDESKNVRLYGYSIINPNFVNMNSSFYRASRVSKDGPSSGSFNFTFKDIKKQISNDDGSPYDPNSVNYKYKVKITLADAESNFFPKESSAVDVFVFAPPGNPTFQVEKTTFCLNATVNITCTATTGNPPNTTVLFYRNDVKIREVKNDREAKATVSINLDKSGIQTFTCQASNLVGSSKNSSLLNVTVKDPPTITQCDNQTSTQGEAFSWTCDANGSQPLNTSWVKGDGNTIVSSTKTYNIPSVNRSDAGMYRVTVSNGDECPTASTTVYLTVQYKPEQISVVNSESGFLYVNKGQPINITCTAIANPKPDYVWMFKHKNLHSPINNTIIISNATLDDAGMYTCTAINSIGRESINVTLQVNYLMDASCGPKIHTVNDGDNVALNCSAVGIPAVNYTWTVNNKVSQGPTTTFVATRSLNGSIVTCATRNAFGNKKCSKTLIVYYKPDHLTVINAQGGILYVNKGQPINITCTAIGNPKPDYVWMFKGKQLHSSINNTIIISNATLDDAGMYTCTAINSIGRESVNVTLQVNYLMDASCGPKIHTVNDGDNVALNCSAIGIPAVSYTWTVNNKVSQGPTTTFAATRSLNGSMVTCTAMNSFGNKTCSKTLIVYFKPENFTVVNASKGTLDVDEGQLIDIICNADGYPDPYFLWQKSDQMIQSSNNKNNTITISNATSNDAGVYTCTAVNLVGNESISVTLLVKYIGNAVCAVPASVNEGDAMVLNCSADGYPAVNYTWTTPDKVHQGPTASIPATPDLNGVTVTCKATNEFKGSTCSKSLTVYYKPRNVTVSPSRLVLNETETLNLTCDASANRAGNYSWSLNGKILEGKTNRVLTKNNITAQDAGEYICTVTNSLGADTSNKAVIDVRYIGNAVCTAPSSANEGNTMVLNCSADGYPAVNYTWTTPDKVHQGPTASIPATPDLNGVTVTCKATNTFEISTCTRSLTVNYIPRNVTVSPSRLVLNETETLNLTCDVSANPAGNYSWALNGKILEGESNRVLTKHNITKQDAGDYTCTVTNTLGADKSNKTIVYVRFIGNAVCTAPASANESDAMALNCSADGYPPVSYTWTTPDKVHEGPTASIPATPDLNGVTVTCKATNTFEISICTRSLTVYYKPRNVTVSPSRLVLNETESLNLTCDASANPAGNYSWSLNGKILEGETSRMLTKHNIKIQDAGEYICTVTNSLGTDTSSKAVIDVPHIGAANCTASPDPVEDGNNITLKCSASGYPAVNYNLTVGNLEVSGNVITVKAEPSLNGAVMTCKAVNEFGTRNCTKTVAVHYKPFNIQVSPSSVVLNEKESFNLICNASANPPGEYSWSFNGNVLDGETDKVLAKPGITRDEAGEYRCTVTNSVGSGASNISVVRVRYLEECKNNKYTLTNEQCLTLSPEGFPKPTLNCSKVDFNVAGKNYTLCKPKNNDKCTIFNDAQECQFEYEVLNQAKKPLTFRGSFRCTNLDYQPQYDDKNSFEFKNQADQFEKNLNSVYESYKIVTGVRVTALVEGSVIVHFNLTLVANVSDPLLPLKEAVTKGGGNLSGLVIDPSSIQAATPTTPIPTTTKTPITTPSPISEEAIIAIAVVVPIVVILIIVLVWYFCCKKKEKRGEENISLEEGSPYRQVNGEENRGLSESQTSCARSGPKSDHNGQTTNNNPDTSDATATYAAVDMSKKKEKKQEGEVLYADLGSMRPGNNKGTELQPMSSSGNIPDKRESDYASIDFFKTQKQGEVKEYECLGTFTFTDRKYTKALDNEMTDSFKKLRDEVNTTVKSAYKDDTNFVLVEAEHFKWHPHGTIVIFKLILKEKVADPFLPLKESLEKNGGVVGAMKIIPQSVKEHEEEQNAPGEQKKVQKQDEANAAAKPNVGFLGGKETESSNQDNSSPESQADMSASRDNTTMTTVSL